MNKTKEITLIDELLVLKKNKSAFLDEHWVTSSVERYVSEKRFLREQDFIFHKLPKIALHASEVPKNNSFCRREVGGLPLVFTRDNHGNVHAFKNVCRHRRSRLVADESGCTSRLTCPYHAWSWDTSGDLVHIPQMEEGFPNLDKNKFGLVSVDCIEKYGWIWINVDKPSTLTDNLAGLETDLTALDIENLEVFDIEELELKTNWKILVEGGLEAYHFRVAHKNTIGAYFQKNLSSYETFGNHIRSILPRTSLDTLSTSSQQDWCLRDHANILYSVFPATQLLVQDDHIVWVQLEPLAANRTRLRVTTLIPKNENTPLREPHWRRNHNFTVKTLNEDFELGEGIQAGFSSNVNTELNFGRFEGALDKFNVAVENLVG